MNERTDRMTPAERRGAPDCLVELALQWLQLPFAELTETERGYAMTGLFLLIAQMRHVAAPSQDWERRRWIDRAVLRLCAQVPGLRGHESALRTNVEQRITVTLLEFHAWREQIAPPFHERTATGLSDSGEVTA